MARPPEDKAGAPPRAAVVLVSDYLGWRFMPMRTFADALATAAGVTVLLPDTYEGGALSSAGMLALASSRHNLPSWQPARYVCSAWSNLVWTTTALPNMLQWMWNHAGTDAAQMEVLRVVATAARGKELGAARVGVFGGDAVAGWAACRLAAAGGTRVDGAAAPFDALVVALPGAPDSGISTALAELACPSLWVFSDDPVNASAREVVQQALAAKQRTAEFATRAKFSVMIDTDAEDPASRTPDAAQAVLADAAAFFRKHLRGEA